MNIQILLVNEKRKLVANCDHHLPLLQPPPAPPKRRIGFIND